MRMRKPLDQALKWFNQAKELEKKQAHEPKQLADQAMTSGHKLISILVE